VRSRANAINTKVMGISATAIGMRPDLRAHSILCGDWTAIGFNGDRLHRGDNEQMRRIAYRDDRGDFSTGDWDPGFIKAECKYDESVTGVSQNGPLSSLRMSRVLCSTSRDFNAAIVSDCHTLVFSHVSDNRLTTVSGDWAPGYSKNECGERQYVKGVSSTGTGEIHAILCCGFSIRID
jgi:hypothetical protein